MQQIDIDFDVWKALTLRRRNEAHSYNAVLRELLDLPATDGLESGMPVNPDSAAGGRSLGGRRLLNGTRLRSKYKGEWHHAEIKEGQLIGPDGQVYQSASAAARAITSTNVNGLTFWEVKRPEDGTWKKLISVARSE